MRTNQPPTSTTFDPGLRALLRALKQEKQATAQELLKAQEEGRATAALQLVYRELATVNGFLLGRSHQIFDYNQYLRRVRQYDTRLATGDPYAQEPKPYTGPAPAGGPELERWLHPRLSTLIDELEESVAEAAEDSADHPADDYKLDRWRRCNTCYQYLSALQAKLARAQDRDRETRDTHEYGKVYRTEHQEEGTH
jgi:hypothetical protein